MSAISSSSPQVQSLLAAMGLIGQRVISLSLHFRVGCPVTADIEAYADSAAANALIELFEGCEIVRRPSVLDPIERAGNSAKDEIDRLTSAAHKRIGDRFSEAMSLLCPLFPPHTPTTENRY